ncbi:restriction endonuclease subunit S [Psychroflexus aestuariivivens]|uniref:restriction endonuclease subunit S n=1 Tax=Psychroflexus aestuariivivens TaxID=1795040 RepID=UPI000FDAC304|nr:restriction endonuclease subunit S [Psychroflexus aestuariivivens]
MKLENCVDILSGFAFKSKLFNKEEKGLPIIRIRDVTSNSVSTYYDGEYKEEYIIQNGDILIGMDGQFNLTEWRGGKALLNQRVCKIIPKNNKVDKDFIKFMIPKSLKEIEDKTSFVTVKHLSVKKIKEIELPELSLETQKRIAEILDNAAALRDKTQQLLQEYDQLAQSIFLEMFGDPVTNPKGWETKVLGKTCGVGSSKRVFKNELVEKGIAFFRGTEIGKLSEGINIQPTLFITKEHYEELKKHTGIPKIGDLLMPSICPDGRIYKVINDSPFYFKDGRVLWIKINKTSVNSEYLRNFLRVLFATNYNNIASGTTFAELKIVALKKLKYLSPPISLQNQFAEKVNLIEQQKELAKRELKESEDLFQALLQKAFKGELV